VPGHPSRWGGRRVKNAVLDGRPGNFAHAHPEGGEVDRLLFSLAQMECSAAAWLTAAGDNAGAQTRVATAVELLSGIERARAEWTDLVKRRPGDGRRRG
jgi:hypothetical protein